MKLKTYINNIANPMTYILLFLLLFSVINKTYEPGNIFRPVFFVLVLIIIVVLVIPLVRKR